MAAFSHFGSVFQNWSPASASSTYFPLTTVPEYSIPLRYSGEYAQAGNGVTRSVGLAAAHSTSWSSVVPVSVETPGTDIPAELCRLYGIPFGSKWGRPAATVSSNPAQSSSAPPVFGCEFLDLLVSFVWSKSLNRPFFSCLGAELGAELGTHRYSEFHS